MDVDRNAGEVVVVIDPAFADRLIGLIGQAPIWIARSEANAPVVESLRSRGVDITTFRYDPALPPEQHLLSQLPAIDLHHGPYSSDPPYRVLKIIGVSLTAGVRDGLTALGLDSIEVRRGMIVARRALDPA